jgi:hypothetical protein
MKEAASQYSQRMSAALCQGALQMRSRLAVFGDQGLDKRRVGPRRQSGAAGFDLVPVEQVLRGFPHVLVDSDPGDVRVAGGDRVDDLLVAGH